MDIPSKAGGFASEHRGVPLSQPESETTKDVTKQTEISQSVNEPKSFSNTVKASLFPRKEQAIIYPAIDGLQVRDYVVETGKIVGPKNILFASRMSNNRICIYLTTKTLVESFVEKEGGITINDIYIPVRKLIIPARRFIVSNVSPCIPHHVLEERLKNEGVKLVSPVSFMGAGIGVDEYRHVLSFRRQFFATEDTTSSIPPTLLIKYDDEEYRVFLTDDQLKCFRCKEVGHVAAKCQYQLIETVSTFTSQRNPNKRPPPSSSVPDEVPYSPTEEDTPQNSRESNMDVTENISTDNHSRQISIPLVDEGNTFKAPKNPVNLPRNPTKRAKLEKASPCLDENYDEIEVLWRDETDNVMSYIEFTEFLKKAKGKDKPIEIARRYTDNIAGLIDLIKNAKPLITNRAPKERCRRLVAALKKALLSEGVTTISPPLSRTSSQESLAMSQEGESSEQSSY